MWVGCQRHALAASVPGEEPIPIVQEAGWAPEPISTVVEYLAPTGIRSPDRPVRSELINRLCHPALKMYVAISFSQYLNAALAMIGIRTANLTERVTRN
jgi:hypothetical protein